MYDVFVAGLGVMGSAAARAFARAGLRVAGCDAQAPPHDLGSSHGESRIIRTAYFEDPRYAPIAVRALELWRELEQETGAALLRITGGVNIGPGRGLLASGALATARTHDIVYETLHAREAMRRFPALHIPAHDSVIYEPGAGILDPERCVAALSASARHAGADLFLDAPLLGWSRDEAGVVVETAAGTFTSRRLVLALGAWLPRLYEGLPLRVTRQPVFWFETNVPELHTPESLPHYLIEFEPGRIFYGFPDLGNGLKCAIHHEGEETSPDDVDRITRADDLAAVRALLRHYLPQAAGRLLRSAVCLYTSTPDGHFLIEPAPGNSDVWLMSPCSGHGFKFAPALAEQLVRRTTTRFFG